MASLNGPTASISSTEVTQMETENCFILQKERDTDSLKIIPNYYLMSYISFSIENKQYKGHAVA
jgi:hypothetical protein